MKKSFIKLSAILLLIIFLSTAASCGIDPFDPPGLTPTNAPADWIVDNSGIEKYTKVAAININDVPARLIKLPKNQSSEFVKPLSDGGCIAFYQIFVKENDSSRNGSYYFHTVRFKADGTVLWDKQDKTTGLNGYAVSMRVFPDDGFVVSIHDSKKDSASLESVDKLARFSSDGSLLWMSEDEQTPAGSLYRIFALPDGSVIAAGSVPVTNPDRSVNFYDIGLLRFDRTGNIINHSTFSFLKNMHLSSASFENETGFVFTSRRNSEVSDSDQADTAYSRISQIDCFDKNLNIKWSYVSPPNEDIFKALALPGDEGSLVFTSVLSAQQGEAATTTKYNLIHFNTEGNIKWTCNVKSCPLAAARLIDGSFILGLYQNTTEGGEYSCLSVINTSGILLKEINLVPGSINQIVPTKDGGVTIILSRKVRALPQPPHRSISFGAYDSEAIVVHYDKALNIVWCRTIDQYKNDQRLDIIIPTSDDRLLVG